MPGLQAAGWAAVLEVFALGLAAVDLSGELLPALVLLSSESLRVAPALLLADALPSAVALLFVLLLAVALPLPADGDAFAVDEAEPVGEAEALGEAADTDADALADVVPLAGLPGLFPAAVDVAVDPAPGAA